jgi:hypothetical protein
MRLTALPAEFAGIMLPASQLNEDGGKALTNVATRGYKHRDDHSFDP